MAIDKQAREERRKAQEERAKRLEDAGVFEDLFARIDAGEIQLDGDGGFIQELVNTGLADGADRSRRLREG